MLALVLAVALAAAPAPKGALEQLAADVVAEAARASPEPPFAVWVDATPPVVQRTFASLVAAEAARHSWAPVVLDSASPAAAETAARAQNLHSLLRVSLLLEQGKWTARGDLLSTWVNFWSGRTPSRGGPAALIAATVDADPQSLKLASAPLPAGTRLDLAFATLARLPRWPAALAAADFDGDRKAEVVALLDDELLVLSSDGRTLARRDLSAAPLASPLTREPYGQLSLEPPLLHWHSGRHAAPGALQLKDGRWDDAPALASRLIPGTTTFTATPAKSGAPLAATTQSALGAWQLLVLPDGAARLWKNEAAVAGRIRRTGSACLADLDHDGTPELAVTSPRFFPETDELRLLAWPTVEALHSREGSAAEAPAVWSGPTPRGRVLQVVAADFDGDGQDELLLGAWLPDGTGELQLARRLK